MEGGHMGLNGCSKSKQQEHAANILRKQNLLFLKPQSVFHQAVLGQLI